MKFSAVELILEPAILAEDYVSSRLDTANYANGVFLRSIKSDYSLLTLTLHCCAQDLR